MKRKQRIILSIIIFVSALLCLIAAGLTAGYENSRAYELRDSKGNELGFNNPLTWELCVILLKNATPTTVVRELGWYGAIYLFAHFVSLLFLGIRWSQKFNRTAAIWFWLQLIIFPTSWIGCLIFVPVALSFITGQADGETISDFPFWWTVQPIWLITSATAGFLIWAHSEKGSVVSGVGKRKAMPS